MFLRFMPSVNLAGNDPKIRWRYRVHEQILPALRAARHDVRFTDIFPPSASLSAPQPGPQQS
jgi:hypothetical protein